MSRVWKYDELLGDRDPVRLQVAAAGTGDDVHFLAHYYAAEIVAWTRGPACKGVEDLLKSKPVG